MYETKKWKSKFFIVAFGQAISLLGSHGVQFALIWWLAEKTSSPLMLGISGLVAYLPMTLFSPVAGIAADRLNRKIICIVSDLSMGILAAVYAGLLFFFDLPVWTVFIMLCARGIGNTFQQPAIQSIIPQLVPSDQLVKTNGWMQMMNAGSFFLGPVIGASLYAAFPMSVVLISDIIGAALASAALAVVKVPELEKHQLEKEPIARQLKEGFTVFQADSKLFYRIVWNGNFSGSLWSDTTNLLGMVFLRRCLRMSRRVGKYPFHSLNRVYSGNRCSGKNGKGLFRAYLDFLCNNACRFTGGEPCRGKSRCKCLVFSVWRQYDNYYKYPDMVQ